MTEFMPLFAGSAGDQWPVAASLKKHVATRYSRQFWMFFAYKKIARPNCDANS